MAISSIDKEKDKDKDIIDDIDSEIEAAICLLNNLLEAEKIDDQKLMLVASYCNHSFILSTVKKYAILASNKKISYEIHNMININEVNFMLYVDKYKIEQVMRNLISNSIKFTPEYGAVSVTMKIEEGKLVVEVADNGVGVSVNRQCEMFQQFQQLSSTSFGGSGLGLFISKEIALIHNGSLEFSSDGEGQGSSFKLLLPIFDVNDALQVVVETDDIESNTCTISSVETKQQNTKDSTLIRIMVCDDSTLNRKYLVKTLKTLLSNSKMAYLNMIPTFQEVDDGAVLVSCLESDRNNKIDWPTIIFMDNIMTNMNGPDATKAARLLGFDSFIVGISGNMMTEDVSQFFDAGCSHFLGKPVDIIKLETVFLELHSRIKTIDTIDKH
jgi:CheY-like chemotaxis protein/anti-sigma regulatory factor (Ser/Thr protein kinase)